MILKIIFIVYIAIALVIFGVTFYFYKTDPLFAGPVSDLITASLFWPLSLIVVVSGCIAYKRYLKKTSKKNEKGS